MSQFTQDTKVEKKIKLDDYKESSKMLNVHRTDNDPTNTIIYLDEDENKEPTILKYSNGNLIFSRTFLNYPRDSTASSSVEVQTQKQNLSKESDVHFINTIQKLYSSSAAFRLPAKCDSSKVNCQMEEETCLEENKNENKSEENYKCIDVYPKKSSSQLLNHFSSSLFQETGACIEEQETVEKVSNKEWIEEKVSNKECNDQNISFSSGVENSLNLQQKTEGSSFNLHFEEMQFQDEDSLLRTKSVSKEEKLLGSTTTTFTLMPTNFDDKSQHFIVEEDRYAYAAKEKILEDKNSYQYILGRPEDYTFIEQNYCKYFLSLWSICQQRVRKYSKKNFGQQTENN